MDWPKSSFRFPRNSSCKIPNTLFDQPNNLEKMTLPWKRYTSFCLLPCLLLCLILLPWSPLHPLCPLSLTLQAYFNWCVELLRDAPWPGTIVAICMSCFRTGSPGKKQGTNNLLQPEGLRKGQKETPYVRPPPRILLSGVHLGWTRPAPPGRRLSQNDGLKKTQRLIPSPENPRLRAMWQSSSPGFPSLLLSTRAPFPNKISCFVSTCVSFHFWVLDKSPVSGPGRGPPSYIRIIYVTVKFFFNFISAYFSSMKFKWN